jgi:hypothetical protein
MCFLCACTRGGGGAGGAGPPPKVEHIEQIDRQIDRILQKLSSRTKTLATDPLNHIDLTDMILRL